MTSRRPPAPLPPLPPGRAGGGEPGAAGPGPAPGLDRLVALVARLRAPDGCPWDREQTLTEVRSYLLEEAHELAAAIDEGDWEAIGEELGDLLFQAAFVTRLGEEAGALRLDAVLAAIHAKMVERHPHVFGGEALPDAAAVSRAWERRKLAASAGGNDEPPPSLLAGVPTSLPALVAAHRMTQKAAGVGFDWPDAAAVLDKVEEETAELAAEIGRIDPAAEGSRQRVADELGDLLFTVANLARKLGVDPEAALAGTNRKFRRRFAAIERSLAAAGRRLGEVPLDELDALWEQAKAEEG